MLKLDLGQLLQVQSHRLILDNDALQQVFNDMKTLGRRYVEAACRGENIGFSNMHQLLTDIAQGTKKVVPCGAGLGLLAVDKDGDLHLMPSLRWV